MNTDAILISSDDFLFQNSILNRANAKTEDQNSVLENRQGSTPTSMHISAQPYTTNTCRGPQITKLNKHMSQIRSHLQENLSSFK